MGRSLTGTEKTINSISRRQLLNYQDENYVTASTLVVAAGNLQHEKVVKSVRRYSDKFPRGKSRQAAIFPYSSLSSPRRA